MSPFKSARWIEYVQTCVRRHKYKYANSKVLKDQDWEDLTQDILLHIWQKRKKYKVTMFLKPWLKTIVSRQVQNFMRDKCVVIRDKNYHKRSFFIHPRSLYSLMEECDFFGEIKKEYTQDMIDEGDNYYNPSIDDLKNIINDFDIKLIKNLLIDCNYKKASKRLSIKPVTYYGNIRRITNKIKNAKNAPVAF